jgi:N-carbamoyl-L-amino-acid hydrolase
MRINSSRLHHNLEQLSQIGRTPDGALSRVAFSEADIEAREFVKELMRGAGLAVRVDAVGNIFGRREGTDKDAAAILMGSHIDTVPDGGAFDGALGVLAAIEVAQTLEANRHTIRHPLEVAVWSDEEGGLSGSRGFIGELPQAELDKIIADGMTLGKGIERLGGNRARIADARSREAEVAAYLELHVEQGGRLESEGVDIGVVTGIVGIRHYDVTFTGTPNHAGTTPMNRRQNALLAASESVLAVDRVVKSVSGSQVGTVGQLCVYPGAPNVIPGSVQLTVELRDLEMAKIDAVWTMLEPELNECAAKFGTTVKTELDHSLPGVLTDPAIQDAISGAAKEIDLKHCFMPSGAGHDAQNLARIAPTGMIFVPSVGGVSHSREEHTGPKDVTHGGEVLLRSLLSVDRS